MQLLDLGIGSAAIIGFALLKARSHVRNRKAFPRAGHVWMNAIRRGAQTDGALRGSLFDSSANVISSRIASSATPDQVRGRLLDLNSGEWFFLFVTSDRLSSQAIYLNLWSEILRPPLRAAI